MEPRSITILGSTGSVGCNTIDLIERDPAAYRIEALTANQNVEVLAEQARRLKPRLAVITEESKYEALKDALSGTNIAVASGRAALREAAEMPADWVMAAIVGAAGLEPTLAAISRGVIVALANKECLACAGELVMQEVRANGTTLLPVDSEHNAIFQVFEFERHESVERLILTASGGPFRSMDRDQMASVTAEQAVAHPNWDMGAKISVDSATMMNKGLEMIEAYHLFPVDAEQIEVVIHPQSVVHSLVAYIDGSVLAQLGSPDMRTPIAYTLGWPKRIPAPAPKLDLAALGSLTFERPDAERFPALRLAHAALETGGGAPTILNAANEIAVHGFLKGEIGFLQITEVVEHTLGKLSNGSLASLDDVIALDQDARAKAQAYMANGMSR
ncbi:MAG: 1-deoxy-D-xylulose-5-phosphate reductoisomerase [Alphaproteobacteria bacterium]